MLGVYCIRPRKHIQGLQRKDFNPKKISGQESFFIMIVVEATTGEGTNEPTVEPVDTVINVKE
jgi:hypothetical protein